MPAPRPRPRRRRRGCGAAALALALLTGALPVRAAPAAPASAPRVLVYVFPAPGLFDAEPDGHIGGAGGALLQRIQRASQVPFDTEMLPVARVQAAAVARADSCVVGIVRTPEREPLLQWVGVVSRAALTVYGRDDGTPPLPSLSALRGQRVAVIRETANAAQLREQGIPAHEVSGTLNALRMLQAGRVDYWYSHTYVAESAASTAGGTPLKQVFSTPPVDGYLACNLAVPTATIEKLRTGLKRLRQAGELADFGLR